MSVDDLYLAFINKQSSYLAELQKKFNEDCEIITASAQEKLKNIPEDQKEERQQVIQEQKRLLTQALENLRRKVNASQKDTRHELEKLQNQRVENVLADLESRLSQI